MKDQNVSALVVTHVNCYTARFDKEDIVSFHEDDKVIVVTLKNDYQYEASGLPRWEAVEPFE